MLTKLLKFDLLTLLLYHLRLGLLDGLSVVESVILGVRVDVIAALRLRLAIVIDFQVAALDLFAIHLDEGLLGTLMCLVLDVGEALRFLRLPVVSDSNGLDLSEASEPIANIVLLESVGEPLDEKCAAVSWHQASHFYITVTNRSETTSS